MLRRILQLIVWLFLLGILTIFLFLGLDNFRAHPVFAISSHQQEAPGQMLYRSQQKLKDASGNTWQVILFKRVYPEHFNSVHIRLVGYPGSAEVLHPQPLIITSTTGKIWKAKDIFLDEAPAPTIGQYDLKDILPELPTDDLLLSLPLGRERFIKIVVPQVLVREWQEVANQGTSP